MISRRRFIATTTSAVGASLLVPSWSARAASLTRAASQISAAGDDGFMVLEPKPATAPLSGADKPPVNIWGYRGSVPGPVVRVKKDGRVRVRLKNALPQATSIHWHGIRIDNAMDGVAGLTQDAVAPGGTFDYSFTAPDAGTFWYHPHNKSWEQMARGLYGLLIVDEDTPPAVDRDIAFVADDWRLGKDGQLDEQSFGNLGEWSHGGRLGNWLTVNGLTEPDIPVRAGERLRLRCVNTANARILAFEFGNLTAHLIALDGQPVAPQEYTGVKLTLAPGQRADVVIDIQGQAGDKLPILEASTRDKINAATFTVSDAPPVRTEAPTEHVTLPPNKAIPLPDLNAAQTIELMMEGGAMGGLRQGMIDGKMISIQELVKLNKVWAFNGLVGMQKEPLARIPLGRTATINMVNRTAFPHAMHLHGFHFRVIERNGKPVANAPWRDTELVGTDEQVRIAFVADNPGKWLLHCHMLEHQAAGMITRIEVG